MANYYNESYYHPLILEYQLLPPESPRAKQIAALLYVGFVQISKAIIFRHKFYKYDRDIENLISECVYCCYKSLTSFDPTYITSKGVPVTAFNYFSLVCKRGLIYYTLREQKHRSCSSLIQYHETEGFEDSYSYGDHWVFDEGTIDTIISSSFNADFFNSIRKLLSENIIDKKLTPAANALQDFLKSNVFNKRFFAAYCQEHNVSKYSRRKFLIWLKANQNAIMETIDVKIN